MSSTVYNHRSLQPSASVPPPPQSLGIASQHRDPSSHSLQRLNDSFEVIRQEFDILASDVGVLRSQRDEYEAKLASQVNELNIIRQALYDLETQHTKIRAQYEEELAKLRAEVHSAAVARPSAGPTSARPTSSSNLPPGYDYYRDRDRDRDRERADRERLTALDRDREQRERERIADRDRDRIVDNRDPKRLKVDSRRPELMHGMSGVNAQMLPKMPPLTPGGASSLTSPKSSWRERERDLPPSGASPKVAINPGPPTTINLGRDPRDSPSDTRDLARERDRELAVVPSRGTRTASPASHARDANPNPVILADLDPHALPAELRTEASDWFCIFNPSLSPQALLDPKKRRNLDISLLHTLQHQTVVCCVQFSSDGKYLATGCNRTAQIFDVKSGNKVCVLTDETAGNSGDLYIRSVRFSPEGRYLATGAEDKRIRIWDIARKKILVTFSGHTKEIYALDFTPDGRHIVSGSGDQTARIWNLTPFLAMPDGQSPRGPPADPADPAWCMVLTISDSPNAPLPAPSSTTSTTSNANTNSNEANSESNSPTDAGVTSVAVSPDGKFLAAGSIDCLVRIWDINTGALLERLQGHQNSVYSVVFTPNGRGVISGSLDRTMKYWDVSWLYTTSVKPKDGGKCLMNFVGHKDYVLSVAVSHDSQWIVSGSKDRGVQFWDSRNANVQCMLQGHKNSVISIALNPVGNLLASGSGDNLARIWKYTPS